VRPPPPPPPAPTRVLDTALELLPAGSRGDDVAVLAAAVPGSAGASGSRIQRSLPAQPRSVPLARSWAEGWLVGSEVPAPIREAALLVVSELVTNAVGQVDGPVRITLEVAASGVVIEVFDSGHRLPALGEPEVDATSGRGLRLVDSLSDEWGVREELDGKAVWSRIGW
jgi:anti-sigma regulatory factor (Ser/Thr protein kinase)